MNKTDRKKLETLFEKEVHNKAKKIDPLDEFNWLDLTIGWGLGKGLTPSEAIKFALYIRYDTELG